MFAFHCLFFLSNPENIDRPNLTEFFSGRVFLPTESCSRKPSKIFQGKIGSFDFFKNYFISTASIFLRLKLLTVKFEYKLQKRESEV